MQPFEDNQDSENPEVGRFVKKFQSDFIKGSLAYLTIASLVRGDIRDAETIFNSIVDPIVGNRNKNIVTFDTVMPAVFEKIVEYCNEAVAVSQEIENKEFENG